MTDHEKRIREALAECSADGDKFALISTADLRALLADLDAVRGALEENKFYRELYAAMLAARPLPTPPKEQSAGGLGLVDAVADPRSATE